MRKLKLIVENDEIDLDYSGSLTDMAEILMSVAAQSDKFEQGLLLAVGGIAEAFKDNELANYSTKRLKRSLEGETFNKLMDEMEDEG